MPQHSRIPAPVVVALVVLALILAVYSEVWLGVIYPHPFADDFAIYTRALDSVRGGESPYLPYIIGVSYLYHPIVLSIIGLLAWLGHLPAAFMWTALNVAGYAISVILSLRLLSPMSRQRRLLIGALLLVFAPLWEMIHIGQINGIVLACIVGSLYLSEADRPILAGLALAAAIAFKSSPVILLLWFLAGGRWRVAVSALAGFALLTLIGWVQFGPAVTHDYFGVLTRLGTETHPDFYNQSFPALTLRVLARAGVSGADTSIASMHKLGGVLLIGFVLGLTAAAPRRDARLRVALYGLLLAVMTVASPLVWYHHNVFLILPLIVLLAQEEPPNWVFIAGIAVYFLLQSERLFEQIMPALPYEYVSPEKQLSGRQALAGLPVLVAQGLLLITLGWWAIQRVVLQPRLPHPPTQP